MIERETRTGPGALVLLAMLLFGTACTSTPEPAAPAAEPITYEILRQKHIVPAVQKHPVLKVSNPHGDTRFRPASARQIEVIAAIQRLGDEPEIESLEIQETETGAEISVTYPSDAGKGVDYKPNGHRKGRVDLVIFVPPGVVIEATGHNDLIHARRIDGSLKARTVGGKMKIAVWGSVDLETDSGPIQLTLMKPQWGEPARVVTRSGSVTVFTPESADPDIEATSGDSVQVLAAYDYQQSALRAQHRIERQGDASSQLTVLAETGAIELRTIRF